MGHQTIKQPNNRYALWSSTIDNFLLINATPEEIIEYKVKAFKKEITEQVNKIVEGEKPFQSFTLTFEKAIEIINNVHGQDKRNEVMKEIELFDKYKDIFKNN